MIWRSAVLAAYVALALVFGFVLGGGIWIVLFFAVWGGVWLGFSLFWGWAQAARRALLRK